MFFLIIRTVLFPYCHVKSWLRYPNVRNMKIADVPQDVGISEDIQVVSYATDEDGRYVKVGSSGWEPINVANSIAWAEIAESVRTTVADIKQGRLSPLAFYMAVHQMDVALLANYTGFFRWRVKRHLKPCVFAKLKSVHKEKYAALFRISVAEFEHIPSLASGEIL